MSGPTEAFPRRLEIAVAWALPLAVIKLPHLSISTLHGWLRTNKIKIKFGVSDRPLRAFLVARAGKGMVILDGSDPEDEVRFSLAHEVAHFILDYSLPREKVMSLLGESGLDILDGLRPPTVEERLTGLFRGLTIGPYSHLLARSSLGSPLRQVVLESEDNADRLAIELLAPREIVLSRLRKIGAEWNNSLAIDEVREILNVEFGLPVTVCERLGRNLITGLRPTLSFKEWLYSK
jgi:hypothetical protein